MAHGHADYGVGSPIQTVHTSTDIAELAARLGSPDTFDRRGNVLWYDDFEGGVEKWTYVTDGVGGGLEWSAESSKTGRFSAKLKTPPNDASYGQMRCRIAYPQTSRVGLEIAFSIPDGLALTYVWLTLHIRTSAWLHSAQLKYDVPTDTLAWREGALWTDLSPVVKLARAAELFHVIKVVADMEKKEYVRAVLDNNEWDLTGETTAGHASPDAAEIRGYVQIRPSTDDEMYILVDNAIITHNEP